MADRGPVKIREGNIDQLIAIYKSAYNQAIKTIVDATEAGKIQRARVMLTINAILKDLGVKSAEWIEREIPQYYLDGANAAIQDLRRMNVDVMSKKGLLPIDAEAIKALTDDTALGFAESIRGVGRNAERVLSDAVKQQINFTIAEGRLTSESKKVVVATVEQTLRDQGLGALTDKAGRTWDYEVYARMLVRTKSVEARNQGLGNKMLQNGYDLVQVTDHNSDHPACAKYEGKILSMTGQTKPGTELPGGLVVFATYAQATAPEKEGGGIFHPNCEHAINAIDPDIAAKTEAYDNPYNYLSQDEKKAADLAFENRNKKDTSS